MTKITSFPLKPSSFFSDIKAVNQRLQSLVSRLQMKYYRDIVNPYLLTVVSLSLLVFSKVCHYAKHHVRLYITPIVEAESCSFFSSAAILDDKWEARLETSEPFCFGQWPVHRRFIQFCVNGRPPRSICDKFLVYFVL